MQVISEGPIKITKASIDAAWRRRKPDHRLVVRDKDCRGLALIVNSGSMTWSYSYRSRGTDPATGQRWPNRTMTLGNPASLSADDARREANRFKGRAAAGRDPVAERKAAAEAARRKQGGTVVRLIEDYGKALAKRPKLRGVGLPSLRYVTDELSLLRLALAAVEHTPVVELAGADIRQVIGAVSEKPATARARFGAVSRFLDWCQDAGHINANPCALIARSRRPKAPQARAHYLTPTELASLWRASEWLPEPVWRGLARFLIAVPCRRGEATHMEWSHVDLASAEWRQPAKMTKNGDPHRLHLHPLALVVLQDRQKATDGRGLVFAAPKSGDLVDTFSDMKAALTEAAGLNGWTFHDFRRSFATALGEAGFSEAVADAVLNHRQSATRGGVLGNYQRASRWPEQVKAMQLWGRLLSDAIEGRNTDTNVVTMIARAET